MKKKKEIPNIVDTLIIILLVIVAIMIIFMCVKLLYYSEPHFKITKEECRNETFLDIGLSWEILEKIDNIEYYYRKIGCDYIKELKESMPTPKNVTKEVCEQVEVDIIQTKFNMTYYFDNGEVVERICDENTCRYCYEGTDDCWYSHSGISKDELTKQWFDENCECVKIDCIKEGIYDDDNNEWLACPVKYIKCSKYKCGGNYTIEVK